MGAKRHWLVGEHPISDVQYRYAHVEMSDVGSIFTAGLF